MEIKPLAFDSFGVRSMATYVETEDIKILIDPGVSLAPRRFGLPPHLLELERLDECAKLVEEYAEVADVLVVTHYHYDHHDLGGLVSTQIYSKKTLYTKHPTLNINRSQRFERAPLFLKTIEGLPGKVEYADGRKVIYGKTVVQFSEAVCHGTDSRLGYVVEVNVKKGRESFIHTSDVEGPSLPEQTRFILKQKPRTLIVDGPMGYMLGYRYSQESLNASVRNLMEIISKTHVETMMLEHHFMRELAYKSRAKLLYAAAEKKGVRVCSAAEYIGRKIDMLEARRRELYGKG